uniref:Uncharacterized protein n=1 Tax=Anopheles atroparvus TaxID=41427 RepID=A0A182J3D7_ANOAO
SEQLSKILARAGHNVTLLNIFKEGSQHNLHFIKLNEVDEILALDEPIDYLELHRLSPLELHASFIDLEVTVCKHAIASNQLSRLINYPKNFKFDLIIHDYIAGPCLLLLLERFNHPPLILASASDGLTTMEHVFGAPLFPGFIPNKLADISMTMGYIERGYNFLITHLEPFSRRYYLNPLIDQIVSGRFPNISSVSHLEQEAIVVLLNSIALLAPVEPKIWRVINVGGLHIEAPRPYRGKSFIRGISLNTTFEKCVYVSFGSNIKMNSLENLFARSLIATARQLPSVMFLWKTDIPQDRFTGRFAGSVPDNLFTSDWFPQNDVFSSGIVDVFITHGGLLGVQEAIWYGVPMLGVPNYGDQYHNVRRIEQLGAGMELRLEDVNSDTLQDQLLELMHNESTTSNIMLTISIKQQKDTPQRPAAAIDSVVTVNQYQSKHQEQEQRLQVS